ncbi:MAG: flagellar assembly protein FliH [Caulobacteraceae bacterium]
MAEPQKFSFDTVFDEAGGIATSATRMKQFYTAEEVERLVAQARAEAENAAQAAISADTARALAVIAEAAQAALSVLAAAAHEHRAGSAALAIACARKIADAAFDRFPEAPAAAALDALAREIESAPRLAVRAPAASLEAVTKALEDTARNVGFAGQISVTADPTLPLAAFSFDWGDGRAAFNPEQAAQKVAEALEAALAAEGLHGEALATPEVTHGL